MSGVQFGDSSGMPPGVKVVKLSATTSGIANARTVYSPQVSDILRAKAFTSLQQYHLQTINTISPAMDLS